MNKLMESKWTIPIALLMIGLVALVSLNKCNNHIGDIINISYYDDASHVEDVSVHDVPRMGHKTQFYNFHCTATKEGMFFDGDWFRAFFTNERNWSKYGYNGLILLDGTIDTLQPFNWDGYTTFEEISYGVAGRNLISLNFAYVGGVDKYMQPKDTRTPEQKKTIQYLIDCIKESDPEAIIQGHRDNPNVAKACPSFDLKSEYNL